MTLPLSQRRRRAIRSSRCTSLTIGTRAVLVDENGISDPRQLEAIARPFCEGQGPCLVALWYDRADYPTQMPVAEIQLRYQVFVLGRTLDGTENVLWNCNVFPEFEAERRCLPRPLN